MVQRKTINKVLVLGREETLHDKKWGCEAIESCLTILDKGCGAVLLSNAVPESMTDRVLNMPIYDLPLTSSFVEEVVTEETPDAVYAPFVESSGWKLLQQLLGEGYWQKNDIRVLGRNSVKARELDSYLKFRSLMTEGGLKQPSYFKISSLEESKIALEKLGGFPVMIRTENGVTKISEHQKFRLEVLLQLEKSTNQRIVIEECLSGWKEFEVGVLRDRTESVSVVHTSENIMPMGIHSADSVSVSPIQTLSRTKIQILVNKALKASSFLNNFIGYCTIKFAVEPKTQKIRVTGTNFKTDRSATVSLMLERSLINVITRLVIGQTLNDLDLWDKDSRKFLSMDKLILKMPQFDFANSENGSGILNARSKSVGEKIYVGQNFCEALRKAWNGEGAAYSILQHKSIDREILREHLLKPYWDQLYHIAHAFLLGASVEEIRNLASIDRKYLNYIKRMVEAEQQLQQSTIFSVAEKQWTQLKKFGFTDEYITHVLRTEDKFLSDRDVRNKRERLGVHPRISYFNGSSHRFIQPKKKILVLADVLACNQDTPLKIPVFLMIKEARRMGFEIVMISSNTRAIPFWFTFTDRLYVEPLNWEIVYEIYQRENPDGIFIKGNDNIRSQLEVRFKEIDAKIVQMPFNSSNKNLKDQIVH